MPPFMQFEGIHSHPALRRTRSLPEVATQLRAIGAPISVAVHGPPGGLVEQILAQLRGAGVVLARLPVAGPVLGFKGTLLQFFAGADAAAARARTVFVYGTELPQAPAPGGTLTAGADDPPIALLLPAVQNARMAAARLPASAPGAGPAFRGGVRVAVGDIDGAWQLWMLTRDTATGGGSGTYVLTSVQHR